MKLYGLEATIAVGDQVNTRESMDDLLDTLHDSFASDENIYSADLVAEGTQIALLVGVRLDDHEDSEHATKYANDAFVRAFSAAGLTVEGLTHLERGRVQELTLC